MFSRSSSVGVLIAVTAIGLLPGPTRGQVCPEGAVEEVVLDRLKPFGPETAGPDATFGWLFRTMNAFHIRTRESTLRWEMLVSESECLDRARLQESERSLRQLPYIVEADVRSEPLPSGGHRVLVRTQDSWAASAGASVSLDGGVTITGLSASAKNVLGTGTRASLFRTSFRERNRTGVLLRQPNLFGSRVDATVAHGRTQPGRFWIASALRPFSGEVGRWAFRQSWARRDDYFAYSVPAGTDFSHVYRQVVSNRFDVQVQSRWGSVDGSRLLVGLGWGREVVGDPSGDVRALIVTDGDFDVPAPAPTDVSAALSGQAATLDVDRLYAIVGVRRLRFVERSGLDAPTVSQDVPVGFEITGVFGPSIRERAGSTADRWFGLQGTASVGGAATYVHLRSSLEGRWLEGGGTWRDVVYRSEILGYWMQGGGASLFTRVELVGADRTTFPFQLTLGGWTGVRGYTEDAFPAARRLVVNIEERASLWRPSLADVGVAAFVDVGRTLSASAVPFGEASGWRASVGAGLRLAMPRGSGDVLRVDVGLPVTGDRGTHGVVFRIYTELFGLLDRREWPSQLERSRWTGLDTDLTRRPRNPLAGS